jgi:hypothetical protein
MGVYKFSDASSLATDKVSYKSMLAGNTTWVPWEPNGAFDSLATVTVPSGGLASITFAGITNTYKHLQLRSIARTTSAATDNYCNIIFNSDSGANYSYHDLRTDGGGAVQATGLASQNAIYLQRYTGGGATASVFGVVILDVLDYASTVKNKTLRNFGGFDRNGAGSLYLVSGSWMNSSTAINSMTLTPEGGSFAANSQFTLYGVK